MPPLQMPRLSRHEIRSLGKAAETLMTVHESLQHTNWAGAAPSAVIVGQAIEAIAKVYVRTQRFLPEFIKAQEAAAGEAAQQDAAASEQPSESDMPNPGEPIG